MLNTCTFLRACVDEALRMSPPVGGALWREVQEGGIVLSFKDECQSQSIQIPAGIDVGTGLYSLHHNKRFFPHPFTYNPQRWIAGEDGVTKQSVELARSAFFAFSTGPRSCVGRGLAYQKVKLALAHIIWRYEFWRDEEAMNHGDEYLLADHVTGAKKGPWLRFRPYMHQAEAQPRREPDSDTDLYTSIGMFHNSILF